MYGYRVLYTPIWFERRGFESQWQQSFLSVCLKVVAFLPILELVCNIPNSNTQLTLKATLCGIPNWVEILLADKHSTNVWPRRLNPGRFALPGRKWMYKFDSQKAVEKFFKYPFITWICVSQLVISHLTVIHTPLEARFVTKVKVINLGMCN